MRLADEALESTRFHRRRSVVIAMITDTTSPPIASEQPTEAESLQLAVQRCVAATMRLCCRRGTPLHVAIAKLDLIAEVFEKEFDHGR